MFIRVYFFCYIFIFEASLKQIKMGRNKKEITMNVYVRFRVEPSLRKEYLQHCKKNKINPSQKLRDFITNEIRK